MEGTFTGFLRYARKTIAGVFVLSLCGALTEGIGLMLILPMLGLLGLGDSIAGSRLLHLAEYVDFLAIPTKLSVILLLFAGIISVRLMIVYHRSLQVSKLRLDFGRYLFQRIWNTLIDGEWYFLAARRRSDFIHSLTIEVQRLSNGLADALRFVSSVILMLVYMVFAFQLSWQLTCLVIVMAGAIFAITAGTRHRSLQTGQDVLGHGRKTSHVMTQYLDGLAYAKANGIEAQLTTEFIYRQGLTFEARQTHQRMMASSNFLLQWLSMIGLVVFLWLGIEVFNLDFATLLIMVMILSRLLPVWSGLEKNLHAILHIWPSCQYLMSLERELVPQLSEHSKYSGTKAAHKTRISSEPYQDQKPVEKIKLETEIALKGVFMKHLNTPDHDILTDINLTIPAQKITAITGPSGAGKTSLSSLVAGLLPVSQGTITIDGTDIKDLSRQAWSASISYMPQENFMLDGSVADNLRWHAPGCSLREMRDALKHAGAMDFLCQHPDPLEYLVGENGRNLSGGERQRLMLACMLVRKPQLLILDEVTNALDLNNQHQILNYLQSQKGQVTILIITHNNHMLEIADQIVRLENGAVKNIDNYCPSGAAGMLGNACVQRYDEGSET
jgi:ATP-binding cassette subfamily C protein